ncbi:hypothetical protein [Helicobacter sp. T3_23-1056]
MAIHFVIKNKIDCHALRCNARNDGSRVIVCNDGIFFVILRAKPEISLFICAFRDTSLRSV